MKDFILFLIKIQTWMKNNCIHRLACYRLNQFQINMMTWFLNFKLMLHVFGNLVINLFGTKCREGMWYIKWQIDVFLWITILYDEAVVYNLSSGATCLLHIRLFYIQILQELLYIKIFTKQCFNHHIFFAHELTAHLCKFLWLCHS